MAYAKESARRRSDEVRPRLEVITAHRQAAAVGVGYGMMSRSGFERGAILG